MTDLTVVAPGVNGGAAKSGLDALREEIAQRAEVRRPPVTIHVPERPGWRLRFDTNIAHERRQAWIAACTDDEGKVDSMRLALSALAEKLEVMISPDGNEVTVDGGERLKFTSPAFYSEILGVAEPFVAIRKWFGVDAHIELTYARLHEAAGFFDEIVVDPTPGSSTS